MKTLGVIGGLGPMATAAFLELVTKMTKATRDQEHLHVLIDSEPRTPDRTGFLLGTSDADPYPYLLRGGRNVKSIGAEVLAMPCNTAHAFYDRLAAELVYAVRTHYQQPQNFYGVGGLKIFRDLIWQMQGLMKADHRFYKEHGFYDFPQKRRGRIVGMYAVGAMMNNPRLRQKIGGKMTEGMVMPYKKAVEKAGKKAK